MSGKPALNLALTGFHGLAGSEAMLRHVLRAGAPTNVIIFQSVEVYQLPPPPERYRVADTFEAPIWSLARVSEFWNEYMTTRQLQLSVRWLVQRATRGPSFETLRMEADYVPQRVVPLATSTDHYSANWQPAAIREHSFKSIAAIARLCGERWINCLYVHGPLAEPACRNSEAYIHRVSERIAAAGLPPVQNFPLCMPLAQVGDTANHVAPTHKRAYTEYYWDMLKPHLR